MCSVSLSSRRFAVVPPSLRQSHLLPIDQNSFRIIIFDSIFCRSKSWSLFQQPGGNCGLRRESRGSAASIKYAILSFASYECCNYGSQPPFVPNGSLGSSKPMSNQMSAPLGNQESNKVETSDGHLHQAELVRYQSLALGKFSELAENMRSPRSGSNTPRLGHTYFDPHPMVTEAWECLRKSVVKFKGHMVGTIAALDHASDALNYNQVFVRDFVPSALAFLMNDETEIVKNFLLKTLHFQASEKRVDCFTLAQGVMPASFKVLYNPTRGCDVLVADFGETAIGRVAPVDSGFWWIFLLRAYTKATGDYSLSQMPECQTGIKMILSLCLAEGFDTFPTLLCADGCCMIDRRMGIYGYPIEIQALFVMALRCAHQLLRVEGDGKEFIKLIDNRLPALIYHMRSYYWLDFKQLNNIYRYKTEEYSNTAVNKFNVIPESIPHWIFDFMPMKGGYFVGNVSPARMDFRWFALGNCMAILCSLTTDEQSVAIMDLIEERWQDLVGEMPMKAMYPALDTHEWRIVTGCDPKNTHWSYHNGGSWPVLLWLLTAACVKTGRPQIARRALELAECRLAKDGWPEYYDGKDGNYIGKQSRKMQTWSIAGYLVAKMLLEDPSHLGMMALEEDKKMKPMLTRATTMPTKFHPYY